MSVVRRAGFVAALAVLGAVAWKIARHEAEQEAPKKAPPSAAGAEAASIPAPSKPAVAQPAPSPSPRPRGEPGVIEGLLQEVGTGRPVEGVRVRAVPEVAGASVESTPWVATDPRGAFRFTGCLDAPHRIVAQAGPLSPETEIAQGERPGKGPLELAWSGATGHPKKGSPAPSSPLHRLLVEGPGGEPIHRAQVLNQTATTFGTLLPAVDGVFVRDPSVETWSTRYEVFGATDGTGAPLPYGPASVSAEQAGVTRDVTVRLPVEKVLEGRLVGPDGVGVPQVDLRASPFSEAPTDPTLPRDHATGKTGEDGSFRLARLGDIEYRIDPVSLPWSMTPKGSWRARPSGAPIELATTAAVEVEIRLVDPDGAPVADATIEMWREGEAEIARRPGITPASQDGKITLHALDPQALYRWKATAPFQRKTLAPLEVSGWKPADGTHTFPRGLPVLGVLRTASGAGTSGLILRKQPDGTFAAVGMAMADGTFNAGQLPEGDVTLAGTAGIGAPRGPEVTVKAGTKDVTLTVP